MAPFGFVLMVGFWGVVAWAIYHVARSANWGHQRIRPEDELAQRFARGDIDADEYRERLDALRPDGDWSRR
jgi:uncharacterized membrane protein